MSHDQKSMSGTGIPLEWSSVRKAITRQYRVTVPMVVLVSMVPGYVAIAEYVHGGPVYVPEVALDRWLPLLPSWALVYGALYLFLILLPVLVLQQDELIRRTVRAYLAVWIVSFVSFLLYPTVAPRPDELLGDGFAVWGLRFLYGADAPYNCFPSLHVAHSFVSALACYRVNRGLGRFALVCAVLVAVSTLLIKQHYVVDVVVGAVLAWVAYLAFLRGFPRTKIPEFDRRVAPALAVCVAGFVSFCTACYWVAFLLGVGIP